MWWKKKPKTLAVRLGPEAVASLKYARGRSDKSFSDLLVDAIWLQEQLYRLFQSGGHLIFRLPDGSSEELVLNEIGVEVPGESEPVEAAP